MKGINRRRFFYKYYYITPNKIYVYHIMPRKSQSPSFCVKQTDKKYTSPKRKSPPFKANLCCDEIMTGNDGNRWVSVANKKDICTWKPAKKCPKGKVRSPKGRCVNAKKQSAVKAKSAKKCPKGKVRSPKGRCVNAKKQSPVKAKSAKKCPKGKVRSPKGRCVNAKKPSAGKPKPAKKCPKGKVRSPKGRCVNAKKQSAGKPKPAKKQSPVKAKSAKKCPSGKKLSPTGKCIKDTRYGRPSPTESAKSFKEGHKKRGGDGQMYRIVVTKNDTKRWQKV
jgi:hypothetical protein